MSRSIKRIEQEIRSLSPAERAELLRSLIAEFDSPVDPNVERAWLEEARRRYRELSDGKVKGIPGERVFKNLKSRLRR